MGVFAVKKVARFRGSHVNEGRIRASLCLFKNFVLTLVNWVLVSLVKIKTDVNSQPDAVCGT